ncbi:putative UDP-glucuronosyl/UDP-glucosyltransferase, UDP-glycosyltransferase family [Helianthus annuus]|uniref:Glycosyltransferase n=1 Tax=Helianthus annuus TaxID=4232 RepID=A0A251UM37_HELAN|nr:kaempferol 3-O-beta-D-galactosyltransferase [Helianthus annuus]KAF5804735.1 putative UDP-glucuronosyl/UDP-glucosyltransferase, UDP-glycosyltransferase family [Helianthus annuus]KAJ0569306.1 putative UDP-glucuronosyl/UDP-glucosyltransferase, UDP-glycosyltransferase family [Helianthus annuus]KAJ0583617.1 putative UDP-glucuronosyl/UDP-glucosyltransferase, UDP-glycosyltransferase family [Helianthus annuus]KAJ0746338.1 putative UDP-glucuronosyl/UDP-glucosyltransferase, UDP-glycosyltransferase fam
METISNGNGGVRNRHVAVFAFPFASHPQLLLTLVQRLAAATPTVVFSFFSTERTNRGLFSERGCDNILRYDVSDGLPEGYVLPGKLHEDINYFLAVAEKEFKRGVQVAEKDVGMKINCLVVDAFLWFSADLAEELKVPWVALWTAGACSLSAHIYTDLIREKYAELKGSAGLNDEIVDLIPGFTSIRLGDLPSGVILGDLDSPFATMPHRMGRTLTKATAVLINSFQELDPGLTKNLSSMCNNFLNIGPFNLVSSPSKQDEFSCITWLDNQKPGSVAYISFGTKFSPPPHELVALAEALEATKTPFLWSINKDSERHFPLGFLETTTANGLGKIVPWAPQVQVLEHVAIGVFVTHSGWNSVLESIGAGVPMICRPFIGDQPINTWMVERVWGIGVRIEGGNFTKLGTCHALEQVLSADASSKGRKERIGALKDHAHKAVGPNGSSIQNFNTLVGVVTGATL